MKILWFTNTPSNASIDFGYNNCGGGWISSLESLLVENTKHELGICFLYDGNNFKKIKKGEVKYYGIPQKNRNALKRILIRQFANIEDEESFFINDILNEFNPDLIHVFGTESGYGKILIHRKVKVLFNLQGLIGPVTNSFFPPGFSKLKILLNSNLKSILRGITPVHEFTLYKKKAKREIEIIKYWKYFIGRTDWDRNYIKLINPGAEYFHCEEMLRQEFQTNIWEPPSDINSDSSIVIGTTISPNLYKGLDLIYKVASLLKEYKITWKVFGIDEKDYVNRISIKMLKPVIKNEGIKFYGMLKALQLVNQLKTCHFFVHPSYIDNSPNSVCEAMLLGMPVVSSSVGGIKTLIKNGETGFLFNPYDKFDLTGLLAYLIRNYNYARQIGSHARQVALKRHSPEMIISELNKIYDYVNTNEFDN